jgi:DNA-binding NtrC family response regulator
VGKRASRPLTGYRFLIIEDEMMQAWRIGDMIAELGGRVEKIAFNYDQGREALATSDYDCAIVDINLNGELAFPLAAALQLKSIPFVFCTAYAEAFLHHPQLKDARSLTKPITPDQLKDIVLIALNAQDRD